MKILIADKFEDFGLTELKTRGFDVIFEPDLKDDSLLAALKEKDPDVLIVRSTKVPDAMIAAAGKLGLIIRAGAGYDTIDITAARAKGISVANCPGMNSTAVAELAMALMLSVDRRIPDQVADLRQGVWNKKGYAKFARGLKGRTLGLIGVGQIGKLVARRALAFEMKVLYQDIVPCEELDNDDRARRVEREELLRSADVVSLHVPAMEATKNLINAEVLGMMQKHALLINTTRGSVVDQKALATALKNGDIAFAALDVYADEPAATDKTIAADILNLPNFYGTHHVGASTEQAQLAVAEEVIRILDEYAKTKEVLNCVN
ncbi:MAG: hydroxyacid dehydrogenase [Phycisphaerales bacterium]|nr:hydroxyacid dehydrogenase [Phycisphaerales bacterium]